MKRILKSAFVFLPIIVLIFRVNVYVDPASLVNKRIEKEIAEGLLSGKNARGVTTIDDRAMIEYYFDARKEKLDCLVLGASRGMQISRETTGIKNTFNAGVTGAELRDIISSYYMYRDKFGTPEKIIIVLEPWNLSRSYINTRCMTEGYYKFCRENGLEAIKTNSLLTDIDKIYELFTIRYFQQSVNPILSGNFNLRKQTVFTDRWTGEEDIRHWDGSYSYGYSYVNRTDVEKANGLTDVKTKIPDMIKNYSYSSNLESTLDVFVGKLVSEGAEVTFFIPPILPEYYDFIVNETEYAGCFADTWQAYENISHKHGVGIIGSYNYENLSETDFYDVLHPTYEHVYSLFETYREKSI